MAHLWSLIGERRRPKLGLYALLVDNVQLNAGAGGEVCATDDVGGIQFQRVKLVDGTLDSTAAIPGDATNGLDVDVTRVIAGTTATSLGKAEDAASAGGDTGVVALTVRQDTPVTDTSADGDYQPLKTDSAGRLHVNASGAAVPITDNAGSLTVDNAALSVVGGGAEATALRVTIANDSTGVLSIDDNGGSLTVDGTVAISGTPNVAVTSAVPGTAATNLGKAEDVAHASGDVGVLVLAVRRDTAAVGSDVDGDYSTLNVNNAGRLYASSTIDAALPAGANNIGDVDVLTVPADPFGVNADAASATGSISAKLRFIAATGIPITALPASTNTIEVVGDAAHDAAVAGNPVLNGGEARTTNGTAVANGDVVRLMCDDNGRLITTENPRDLVTGNGNRVALTSTTETTLVVAVASQFNDLSLLIMSNESATEVRVDIRDTTAGTVRHSIDLAADGGGAVVPFPVPHPQGAVNTNWTAQLSAAVSTVYVSAVTVARN